PSLSRPLVSRAERGEPQLAAARLYALVLAPALQQRLGNLLLVSRALHCRGAASPCRRRQALTQHAAELLGQPLVAEGAVARDRDRDRRVAQEAARTQPHDQLVEPRRPLGPAKVRLDPHRERERSLGPCEVLILQARLERRGEVGAAEPVGGDT